MKRFALIALIGLLSLPLAANYTTHQHFLATSVTVGAGGTGYYLTNWTDTGITTSTAFRDSTALLTVEFIPAGSSTSTVDFYFQVSFDGGTSWADFKEPISDDEYFSIATNHTKIPTLTKVRVAYVIDLKGVSHIRLSRVKNNDSSAVSQVNATLSW